MVSSSLAEQDEVQQHFSSSSPSSFYTSLPGLIIVTTTACLSALCSGVIVIVILRSRSRLASIYNRIMFFMSMSDVLASAAIALTTLMMPKDMIYKNIFPEIWPIYGTEATCSAQGFIFQTFSFLTFSCDVILCIYYLCSIKFGVSDKVFSSRIEWILYFLAPLIILPKSGKDLGQGNFNPSPERAWCSRQAYPIYCHDDGCIRGREKKKEMVFWIVNTVFMFVVTILCLGLIVFHVYRKDQSSSIEEYDASKSGSNSDISHDAPMQLSINSSSVFENSGEQKVPPSTPDSSYTFYTKLRRPGREGTFNRRAKHYEDTKVIMKQAVAYVSIYIIMGALVILSASPDLLMNSVTFGVIHAVIRPSHGTLNMIIFLYHKYSNVRKHHQFLTCCAIFGKIFRGESEDLETIIETMAPVILHDAIRNVERLRGLYPIDEESEL